MNDINLKGLESIKADQALIDRTKHRVLQQPQSKYHLSMKRLVAAACLAILLGASALYFVRNIGDTRGKANGGLIRLADGSIQIPAVKLPENTSGGLILWDMIGLIVYRGKIYTQAETRIDAEHAKRLVGEKLGTTTDGISEGSKPDDYKEFASTIGRQDFYSVKGYDTDFRIMTYHEFDGVEYAYFYECLNGIIVTTGKDIIGKLGIAGNITGGKYQRRSAWDYSTGEFNAIADIDLLNRVFSNLNDAVPSLLKTVENYWDGDYRRLTITLTEGSEVSLVVLSTGHVLYGHSGVAFKIDAELFPALWRELGGK